MFLTFLLGGLCEGLGPPRVGLWGLDEPGLPGGEIACATANRFSFHHWFCQQIKRFALYDETIELRPTTVISLLSDIVHLLDSTALTYKFSITTEHFYKVADEFSGSLLPAIHHLITFVHDCVSSIGDFFLDGLDLRLKLDFLML